MRYVPIITNLTSSNEICTINHKFNQWNSLINETVINIYYIHYNLHIIHKKNQTIWTLRFLRGNLVTGEKTIGKLFLIYSQETTCSRHKFDTMFSGTNLKETPIPFVYKHQLEQDTNPLYELQLTSIAPPCHPWIFATILLMYFLIKRKPQLLRVNLMGKRNTPLPFYRGGILSHYLKNVPLIFLDKDWKWVNANQQNPSPLLLAYIYKMVLDNHISSWMHNLLGNIPSNLLIVKYKVDFHIKINMCLASL